MKTIKIPRKLKKELKKGVERRIYNSFRIQGGFATSKVTFEGPGTKTKFGRKLVSCLMKEEKKRINILIDEYVADLRSKWNSNNFRLPQ